MKIHKPLHFTWLFHIDIDFYWWSKRAKSAKRWTHIWMHHHFHLVTNMSQEGQNICQLFAKIFAGSGINQRPVVVNINAQSHPPRSPGKDILWGIKQIFSSQLNLCFFNERKCLLLLWVSIVAKNLIIFFIIICQNIKTGRISHFYLNFGVVLYSPLSRRWLIWIIDIFDPR